MLFSPDAAVVAIGGLEQLELPLSRVLRDTGPQCLHLASGHWREAADHLEILPQ